MRAIPCQSLPDPCLSFTILCFWALKLTKLFVYGIDDYNKVTKSMYLNLCSKCVWYFDVGILQTSNLLHIAIFLLKFCQQNSLTVLILLGIFIVIFMKRCGRRDGEFSGDIYCSTGTASSSIHWSSGAARNRYQHIFYPHVFEILNSKPFWNLQPTTFVVVIVSMCYVY